MAPVHATQPPVFLWYCPCSCIHHTCFSPLLSSRTPKTSPYWQYWCAAIILLQPHFAHLPGNSNTDTTDTPTWQFQHRLRLMKRTDFPCRTYSNTLHRHPPLLPLFVHPIPYGSGRTYNYNIKNLSLCAIVPATPPSYLLLLLLLPLCLHQTKTAL